MLWDSLYNRGIEARLCTPLSCKKRSDRVDATSYYKFCPLAQNHGHRFFLRPMRRLSKNFCFEHGCLVTKNGCILELRKLTNNLRKVIKYSEICSSTVPEMFARVAVGVMAVMAVSTAVNRTPSCKSVYCFLFS